MMITINNKQYESGELVAYVEKLEKENAELKEQNGSYEQLIDKGSVTLAQERLKNYKQLSKAKEIIKNLMAFAEMDDREYEKEYKQAEQFLSEVEK